MRLTRRSLLKKAGASIGAPAFLIGQNSRPAANEGVQCGDVSSHRAVIWCRADRPAQMLVEWSTREDFSQSRKVRGPLLTPASDFTGRTDLTGLPPSAAVHYRVTLADNHLGRGRSEPLVGRFQTAPTSASDIRFVWSGDTAGQGWGINSHWGGMRGYEAMRRTHPHFFLHSGDTIYADQPIKSEVVLPDGNIWRNITTEAKSKPAETLEDFRGNYKYNLLDENVRRFNSEVAQIWQWDDHEVMDNWSPTKDLSANPNYRERDIRLIAARGRKAFLEYAPARLGPANRIYRKIAYGPLLDIFVLDMRSYRSGNSYNRQPQASAETEYLGRPQLQWLLDDMKSSRATWKVIAADMPIGLLVNDGKDAQGRPRFENSANGDGPPLGREFEIANLLSGLKKHKVRNTVWITADTHYTAAHRYDPATAQFTDFDPFWEFISGPIHAGTFGPNKLDNTFGPTVVFHKAPATGNAPPSAGLQFFGEVVIDAPTRAMRVRLRDILDNILFEQAIDPV